MATAKNNRRPPKGRGQRGPAAARATAAAMRKEQARREARRRAITAGVTVLAIVAAIGILVLVKVTSGPKPKPPVATNSPAPASLVAKVTGVPEKTIAAIGKGSTTQLPSSITGTALTANGKPLVLYIGAEYCPYCAAERWAVVQAMSRFGTWHNLSITHSASNDVYPNTPTFSFHGATYTSQYLSFTGKETESNQVSGGSYAPLDTLTAQEQAIFRKYVPSGSIPFIDFGNRYLVSGASYNPTAIQGLSETQIADALASASSAAAKGIVGTANAMTAALCKLTNGKPGSVCSLPAITSLQGQLGAG